nr:MAG TPA: hypothetical protein [Caudoviricetes sp.]
MVRFIAYHFFFSNLLKLYIIFVREINKGGNI